MTWRRWLLPTYLALGTIVSVASAAIGWHL